MPFLCKAYGGAGGFGGATRDACRKGPFPGTSHKATCQGHETQTNCSKTSPAFQSWHCWGPLLHRVTVSGLRSEEAGHPRG